LVLCANSNSSRIAGCFLHPFSLTAREEEEEEEEERYAKKRRRRFMALHA
jgi:hypothetical protein